MIKFIARRVLPGGSSHVSDTQTFRNMDPKDGAYAFNQFLRSLEPSKYFISVNGRRVGSYDKEPE